MIFFRKRKNCVWRKLCSVAVAFLFVAELLLPPAWAQELPLPGTALQLTPRFEAPMLLGMTLHAENPLLFDFIIDRGQNSGVNLKSESENLVKYFFAAMTIPDQESWVNLSPYEKQRIIPDALALTNMGKSMLEQDYLLKQLAASLTNPETELGKKYWKEVNTRIADAERWTLEKANVQPLASNVLSKVWIVPEKALVLEHGQYVFVGASHLKVMMEDDYEALARSAESLSSAKVLAQTQTLDAGRSTLEKNNTSDQRPTASVSTEVFREMILPYLEKEVNEGTTFAPVRQMYNAVILAKWYKQNLQDSLLGKIYIDKSKVAGITIDEKNIKDKVYHQYLEAFQKGVYNFIKEEGEDDLPRKYFSGGIPFGLASSVITTEKFSDTRQLSAQGLAGIQDVLAAVRGDRTFEVQVNTTESPTAADFMASTVNPPTPQVASATVVVPVGDNQTLTIKVIRKDGKEISEYLLEPYYPYLHRYGPGETWSEEGDHSGELPEVIVSRKPANTTRASSALIVGKPTGSFGVEAAVSRHISELNDAYDIFTDLYQRRMQPQSVLLIGAGRGVTALTMALRYPNLRIIAINKQEGLWHDLMNAERVARSEGATLDQIREARSRIDVRILDIEDPQAREQILGQEKFDMVLFEVAVMLYVKDKVRVIEDLFNERVKKDGIYAFDSSNILLESSRETREQGPEVSNFIADTFQKDNLVLVDQGYQKAHYFKVLRKSEAPVAIPLSWLPEEQASLSTELYTGDLQQISFYAPLTASSVVLYSEERTAAGLPFLKLETPGHETRAEVLAALKSVGITEALLTDVGRLFEKYLPDMIKKDIRLDPWTGQPDFTEWIANYGDIETGSFKPWIAYSILQAIEADKEGKIKNILASTTGNQGIAMAWVVQQLNNYFVANNVRDAEGNIRKLTARIYVHEKASPEKLQKMTALGAVIVDEKDGKSFVDYNAAFRAARNTARDDASSYFVYHSDKYAIASYAYLATKTFEAAAKQGFDLNEQTAVFAPLGAGGLASGIGIAAKLINPKIKFYLVQTDATQHGYQSFKNGKLTTYVDTTNVSGYAGGIDTKKMEALAFAVLHKRKIADGFVVVPSVKIAPTIKLFQQRGISAEGAGVLTHIAMTDAAANLKALGVTRALNVLSGRNISEDERQRVESAELEELNASSSLEDEKLQVTNPQKASSPAGLLATRNREIFHWVLSRETGTAYNRSNQLEITRYAKFIEAKQGSLDFNWEYQLRDQLFRAVINGDERARFENTQDQRLILQDKITAFLKDFKKLVTSESVSSAVADSASSATVPKSEIEKPVVLYVQDMDGWRETVTSYFERAGFKVIPVASRTMAQDALKRNKEIGLVVTDINLPDSDDLLWLKDVQIPIAITTQTTAAEFQRLFGKQLTEQMRYINPMRTNPVDFPRVAFDWYKTRINMNVASSPSTPENVGGINFDPKLFNLEIKRDGRGVPLPLMQQNVEQIHIEGLYPVIMNIQPATLQSFSFLLSAASNQTPELAVSR